MHTYDDLSRALRAQHGVLKAAQMQLEQVLHDQAVRKDLSLSFSLCLSFLLSLCICVVRLDFILTCSLQRVPELLHADAQEDPLAQLDDEQRAFVTDVSAIQRRRTVIAAMIDALRLEDARLSGDLTGRVLGYNDLRAAQGKPPIVRRTLVSLCHP